MTNYRDTTEVLFATQTRGDAGSKAIYRFVKRFFDVVISLVAVMIAAIPMLVIALAIRLDSPGPALFHQYRVGLDGKLFRICKFRTMKCSAPSETATSQLDHAHSYITGIGGFLRKTSLDELPQLFNVLRGDMSLIGPRPLIVGENEIHRLRTAANVYSVRPGITGWAQINGRDEVSVEEKVAYDAEYVRGMSFAFDLKILLRTVSVVFTGDGVVEGRQSQNSVEHEDSVAADSETSAA